MSPDYKPKLEKFTVPREFLDIQTSRSGGAGGQHVNKVATKVELRFDTHNCPWLKPEVLSRLLTKFPSRLTKDGIFLVTCEETKSQTQNLTKAIEKLEDMITSCLRPPKKRIPTKSTRSSKEKRLESKKLHGSKKKGRTPKSWD